MSLTRSLARSLRSSSSAASRSTLAFSASRSLVGRSFPRSLAITRLGSSPAANSGVAARAYSSSESPDKKKKGEKETMKFPPFLFTPEHEWVALEDATISVIGISKYAAMALGDVVYVELPAVGAQVVAGDVIGAVESVKSASDIYTPVSGVVLEVNEALEKNPGLVNKDCYGEGWICRIGFKDPTELEELMNHERYRSYIATGE
ncbi:glycine cleavage H-protein-domain-containing protein [Myxozyma melibiosi]|uniref:Glycine cleavage system H protein n=1 Tax=Myxozyma melibiosi TaxID=54550 RepID=A0ABR1F010_9ASCO